MELKRKTIIKRNRKGSTEDVESWLVTVLSEKYIINNKAHDCCSRKTTECELSNDSILQIFVLNLNLSLKL